MLISHYVFIEPGDMTAAYDADEQVCSVYFKPLLINSLDMCI